ncbi:MAG: calcium-binding protein, partial [Methylococcaceae bacterium]
VHYSVSLKTQPLRDVTLTFTSSNTNEGVLDNGIKMTFTASNWNSSQTLTVRGVDDHLDDHDVAYRVTGVVSTIDVDYKLLTVTPLTLVNLDDGLDVAQQIYGDQGGSKVDKLQGTDGPDTIYGLNMADDLSGGVGNDTLWGGYGQDNLFGEDGNDKLSGEQDEDYLDGGVGNDTLDGGDGVDTMIGGAGNDIYYLGYDAVDVIDDQGLASDVDIVIMPYQLSKYTLPKGIEQGTIAVGTGSSSLTGNTSNNTLTGNDGSNLLNGAVGRDSLFGGAGNDVLLGGTGNDILSGGTGKDIFKFNVALTANTDKITDFVPVDDTIQLENAIFTKLATTGVLNAGMFIKAAAAQDSNDYIIYNPTTGTVSYDLDGSGAGLGVQIAVLGVNLALTNVDFVVI